jgi:hypothetical protein
VSDTGRVRQRIEVDPIPVRYCVEGNEGTGTLRDVSRNGLFVQASELPNAGSAVTLQFRSPLGVLVDARGQVHWNTDDALDANVAGGFGVRLWEPPREYREFFNWVLGREKDKGDDTPAL